MGKGSPPTPPPPPTQAEINASNVESAVALSELQRDMQFGEGQFVGKGDTDLARKQWEFQKETSPQQTQFYLDQMAQFAPQFTDQAAALVQRSDPTGFAARELLGKLAQEYQPADVPVAGEMEFAEAPQIVADAESMAGRRFAERELIDRTQSGRAGDLMAEEASRLARGRQAATGNIFGGGAVLDEARAVRQAEEQGQRQSVSDLLGFLTSGQSAGDAEARIAQQNFAAEQAAMGQRNQARQQAFANAMQRTGTQQQMQQQQMANLQSFSGLAPVSTQFGGLAGAQQAGAANFNPMQYTPTSGMQLLQNQQGLASNTFGTQANKYKTQMENQAESPFGSILGTVAGAYGGGWGAAAGKAAGRSCHVAREVYGEDNPKWVQFFYWKELEGPEWFKNLYNKHSERIASFIRNKPALKDVIRSWMDSKIQD